MNGPILISGATGYIGRRLATTLADAGLPVIALARDEAKLSQLPEGLEKWTEVQRRALSSRQLQRLAGGLLIHLAGVADRTMARGAAADAALAHAHELRDLAACVPLRGVIVVSSIYATLQENGVAGDYGAHKLLIESVMRSRSACPTITLRLPPVYGEGAKGNIPMLARMIRRGLPLPLGSAREPRDYLAIDNLMELFQCLARADASAWSQLGGMVYEPSDGNPLATKDLARLIGTVIGRRPLLVPAPARMIIGLARLAGKGGLADAAFSPLRASSDRRMEEQVGWKPRLKPPESLRFLKALD